MPVGFLCTDTHRSHYDYSHHYDHDHHHDHYHHYDHNYHNNYIYNDHDEHNDHFAKNSAPTAWQRVRPGQFSLLRRARDVCHRRG